ncbi:hypothetical protein BD324DRAFT_9230 [Kockovaella imperatae]|uniref:K Homology domain-containing protein n=1 Tax=Kockovaella imperatae TaxID=4999 RepID=A0A1Y1UR71_9TREE|nr:hypothetical protein BD324DRAFT_9230 [Kockovaella imperatae]ORX40578.1 hypothetical protein BD324DRAFT_9230 [Kockovaella imperatae]
MALSAAELQKRHGLEGAPDPFPSLGGGGSGGSSAPSQSSASKVNGTSSSSSNTVDTSSQDAFPSLGASSAAPTTLSKPASSMWAAKPSAVKAGKSKPVAPGGLGRSGAPTVGSHPVSDSFSMPANEIDTKALGEVLKKVTEQTGAIVESSTQMRTGLKTFLIKAADQKRLAYARKLIERGLSKNVTIKVEVPITTLGTIIGPKGATLKSITDSTGCKIDIPRRDTLPSYDPKERRDAGPDGDEDEEDQDDEDDEPLVEISVSGPSVACQDAKSKLVALIAGKTSQSSSSIKTIPSSFYPFIAGPKGAKARQLEEELGQGKVKVHIPPPAVWKALERQGDEEGGAATSDRDLSIKVKGDKERVKAVVAEIQRQFDELNNSLRDIKLSIPKRQHRFLVGSAADDILSQTGCIVELPPVEDPSDLCRILGAQANLVPALTLVMDKANAVAVETVDVVSIHRQGVSDPLAHAQKVLRYLQKSSKLRSIADAHSGVKVFPPFASVVASSGNVVIEIVGEDKDAVAAARESIVSTVRGIPPAAITTLEIDPLVHPVLIGKKGTKISSFESTHGVATVFPPVADDSSEVLLVFAGSLDSLPSDKKARDAKLKEHLTKARSALDDLGKDAADLKTETLTVDKKWHRFIIGQGGTVLNALIGEDGLVAVKVGSKSGSTSTSEDDIVTVRGPSNEVDRVVSQIKQIVEDAKNDDIINGYTVEFPVDKKHVPHLVGSAGASINRLRDTLGVRVNFDDDADKKKPKATCKIVGRKEAVEEARRRLEAQIEKLADETTETLNIKRAIQPALIGAGGKYAIRLEEKYGVKLSFPRDNKDGTAPTKPDEVTIRGGRKGVAAAKAELLEAAAFESESRQSLEFTVPSKSVAQIVGKSGATINAIKDETGTMIDIDKSEAEGKTTTITVKGDKKGIAAAKAAILAVVDQVKDVVTVTMTIDPKFHRSLIGQGGQKLRDLVASVGGPTEGYNQAGLITFPKQGDEATDQVRLRGDSKLVNAIKAELEKQVKVLKETIVVGVVVPSSHHATKIGRGGSALQDLQRKTGTTIHFPGSRQYSSVGEPENASELGDAPSTDIVKVIGRKEDCAKAAEQLQTVTERPQRKDAGASSDLPSRTMSIPSKYYHAIAGDQSLLRNVRSAGGSLAMPQGAPVKPTIPRPAASNGSTSLAAKAARIDLDAGDAAAGDDLVEEGDWEVIENYQNAPEGELEWTIRAREENLDKVQKVLEDALEHAKNATHIGLWTGLPRSAFPRIIGSKGATISRLRAETGADIQVGKDDDLITITGDEQSVLQAKDAISAIVSRPAKY